MMIRSAATLLALSACCWSSNLFAHTSSEGEKFITTYNSSGAVLKSKATVIFLGSRCDASSPTYGKGKWEWSNGGFEINLAKKSFGFARQEIDIQDESRCQAGADDAETEPVARPTRPITQASPSPRKVVSTPGPIIQQVYEMCVKDQVENQMSKWGRDPANHNALAVERVYALHKARSSAKEMCSCVIAPLKAGKQVVGGDFMAEASYYKNMQFVCSVNSGPEELLKQFGN